MGIILSYCCRQSSVDAVSGDEREEQSRIWSENSNNNQQQYGACNPPVRPIVYKIVLPKLKPVDINVIRRQHSDSQDSHSFSKSSEKAAPSQNSTQESPATEVSLIVDTSQAPDNESIIINTPPSATAAPPTDSEYPAVIKEEYCAEQFESLRSLILNGFEGQLQFRQLLWSCQPWTARGGKSGSTFMKTLNDQFILKEMSKLELQSFLSIADDYFKYIHQSHCSNQPSLLSTILGIYKIVYTNLDTQVSSEDYYMVMQNLFFNRNIVQRFDLKGSVRNRLVDTNDPDNTQNVLMDENLLRITCEHPLFIHAKSKQVLNEAIDNDSQFLTSISVMDYSLLVGVDKENKELVLGIIDYVRPFTWDKKIERVVKSVVSAELPTIVEPELYRERFCEAMDKYFESVPDDW